MKVKKITTLVSAVFVAVLVAGCDSKTEPSQGLNMPQVSDENCKPEKVAKMEASVRQQFADACSRRGSFKPSTGKAY